MVAGKERTWFQDAAEFDAGSVDAHRKSSWMKPVGMYHIAGIYLIACTLSTE